MQTRNSIRDLPRILVIVVCILTALTATAFPARIEPQVATGSGAATASSQQALLNKYCIACHNEKAKVAGLMLDRLNPDQVAGAAPTWEKVVKKLRTASMPPAGAPRPTQENYD